MTLALMKRYEDENSALEALAKLHHKEEILEFIGFNFNEEVIMPVDTPCEKLKDWTRDQIVSGEWRA